MTSPSARVAWVESPLQLINAIEHAHATGEPLRICPRAGIAQLADTAEAVRPHLPDGVTLEGPRSWPVGGAFTRATRRLFGDVFSGQFRVLALLGLRDLVVVDDGSAALHLAAVLARHAPFSRMGQTEGPLQRLLGPPTAARLRSAMRRGRVEIFTAYADAPELVEVRALGARVVPNAYRWVRAQRFAGAPTVRPVVVLGTALVVDGYVDAALHEQWLTGVAATSPVTYLPHRREDAARLARISALPGVEVVETGLPVELVLGSPPRPSRVITLPSSAAATLAHIVGPAVEVAPIPAAWWTDRADDAMRRTLSALEERNDGGEPRS